MRRLALAVLLALTLTACGAKSQHIALVTGCDGPGGSCARYVPAVDGDGAPLSRASLIVPFTAPVRVTASPSTINAVTAAFSFDTHADELRLVPVLAVRADPQNPRQVLIEVDGLLADGAAIDLPDGVVQDAKGKSIGAVTVKVKTGLSPFAVALAGVVWEPSDRSLFSDDGLQVPHGSQDEAAVRRELEGRLRVRPSITDEQVGAVLAKYDDAAVKKKVPNNRVRAGLLLLTGTSAANAIDFILSDTNRRGVPFEPIAVDDIAWLGAFAAVFYHPLIGRLQMVVDTELAADTLDNIAVVLSHETLHSNLAGGSASEETLAMAVNTRVYEELLLFDPTIAQTPTPFTREANELLLALRNSGRFGYPSAGILPRPGVDDALRGTGREPARSFKDLLFNPDVYGDLPKAGDTGTEVLEGYYRHISGMGDQGRMKLDQDTLRLFDAAMDHGFTDQQILTITSALKLKAAPLSSRTP